VSEHNAPDRPPGKADFEAVRAALLCLGVSEELTSSDEFRDGEGQRSGSRDSARRVRRALVDKLFDVLDASEDLMDRQVQNRLRPAGAADERRLGLVRQPGPVI